jgi:hypothetical protein
MMIGYAQVLNDGMDSVSPGIRPFIHAKNFMTLFLQKKAQVSANLPT